MSKIIHNLGDNNYLDSNSIMYLVNDKEKHTMNYVQKFQNETECVFPHNLNLSEITIVNFNAYCVNSDGTLYFPLPCPRLGEVKNYWFEFYIDTTNIVVIGGGADRSQFTSYVTIEYIFK